MSEMVEAASIVGASLYHGCSRAKPAGLNRRMRKTACPVVWEGLRAQSRQPDPITSATRPVAETMIKAEDSRDPDLSIVVTAYQWKWHYKYQDEGIEFYSSLARPSLDARRLDSGVDVNRVDNYLLDVDRPVVVPVGAKVRLLLTSNDVIHSWWVPELAIKKDAIPGIVNETWFKATEVGTYRGQCTELCGKDHGYMPIVVEVVEPEAFQAWVETRKDGDTKLASAGKE